MTTLVIVVLVLLWIVVLGPSLVRRRHEARSQTAVGRFHRGLRVLRRVGRPSVPAAHSLDRPSAVTPLVAGRRPRPIAVAARPSWLLEQEGAATAWAGLLARETLGRPVPVLQPSAVDERDWRAVDRSGGREGSRRASTAVERRRIVLRRLILVVVASIVVGAIPALRVLWDLAVVAAAVLAMYVVALAASASRRRRRLALRRRVVALDRAVRARRAGSEGARAGWDAAAWMAEEAAERELAEVAGR